MDHSQPSRGNLGFATDPVTTELYEKLRQGTSLLHIYKLLVSGFHVGSGVCCFLCLGLTPPHWRSRAHTDDKHKLLWLSPPRWNRSGQEAGRKPLLYDPAQWPSCNHQTGSVRLLPPSSTFFLFSFWPRTLWDLRSLKEGVNPGQSQWKCQVLTTRLPEKLPLPVLRRVSTC